MFKMKIEQQMNIKDRTLLLGIPEYNAIPGRVSANGNSFNVIGVSNGIKPPYMSLEIEKTDNELIGQTIQE